MPLIPSSLEQALQWLEPIRGKTFNQLLDHPQDIERAWAGVAFAFSR